MHDESCEHLGPDDPPTAARDARHPTLRLSLAMREGIRAAIAPPQEFADGDLPVGLQAIAQPITGVAALPDRDTCQRMTDWHERRLML
ncbi:hypothetical protein G5B40_03850 [Pikeienuella piscinae]|uniref:Uncharacterized protein n=1 Tax=Pikeienuella piscinae TaxID=2748098 RepID=A0A7L5BYG9_9RHOB|nr:hypothetical protein [Pikeienuella piscinae]QIE54649.1 hypothetical protein G5B40_03850 [Pikeienuella piscinae]